MWGNGNRAVVLGLLLMLWSAAPGAAQENTVLPSRVLTPVGWMSTEEHYLPGVVHAELGWFTRDQQALGAQAVAARSYVLRFLNRAGMTARLPALGPTFQAWTARYSATSKSAVLATRGQVMTYKGLVIYANYASGAWPLQSDGNPYDASRYRYTRSWEWIRDAYIKKNKGQIPYSTWRTYVLDRNPWAWTQILVTNNEGKSGADVESTIHNRADDRNRGGLGQYRTFFLATTLGYSHERILRSFYGDDVRIAGLTTQPAPPPPPSPVPPPNPQPSPAGPGLAAYRVTSNWLIVRAGPGLSNPRIGSLRGGLVYVADETRDGWHRIWFRGGRGWASGSFFERVAGAAAVRVTVGSLRVRTGPGTHHRIAGRIHRGEVYATTGTTSGWHRIVYDGSTGYSSGTYLQRITVP